MDARPIVIAYDGSDRRARGDRPGRRGPAVTAAPSSICVWAPVEAQSSRWRRSPPRAPSRSPAAAAIDDARGASGPSSLAEEGAELARRAGIRGRDAARSVATGPPWRAIVEYAAEARRGR